MPPKLDEEQHDYVLLLKELLRISLKHIRQLQQGAEGGHEGPYFPDSLPLSALETLFVNMWQTYEVTPALSMKRVVKEVAAELGGSAPDLYVRLLCNLSELRCVHGFESRWQQLLYSS